MREKPSQSNPNSGKHHSAFRRNPRTNRPTNLTADDIARIASEDSRAKVMVDSRGVPKMAVYFRPPGE